MPAIFRKAARPGRHAVGSPFFRRQPLAAAVLLACAALSSRVGGAETFDLTGNAPVYRALWFNGVAIEKWEFANLLDWQG